jgi:hypothetical protein
LPLTRRGDPRQRSIPAATALVLRRNAVFRVEFGVRDLVSPSRHIYKPLTIAVAFPGLSAFDRVRQGSIKVDGTFA